MNLPEGLSEDVAIKIMYEMARKPAFQYKFGYHDIDDMVEQAILEIIECLNAGKFKPRGTKSLEQQFKNWLRMWMRNKLSNFRRKYSCRYANANTEINQSKFKIMHPLKIHSQGLTQSEIFARSFSAEEHLRQGDALRQIEAYLPEEALQDFRNLVAGEDLPANAEDRLFQLCKEALSEEA